MSQRLLMFVLFAVAYFLSYFFRAANAVIAADLSRDLSLNAAQLGLMTSLFYACFATVQMPIGIGLDRLGPRLVTPGVMLFGAVGSFIFANAESFPQLALGRALIGVGMAGVLMGAFKAFGSWYPTRRLATITGLMVGIGALGGLFAATPLVWLNQQFGWRAIFGWGAAIILLVSGTLMALARNAPEGVVWRTTGGASVAQSFGQIFCDLRFWRVAPIYFFLVGTPLAVQTLWGGPFLKDGLALRPIAVGNLLLVMSVGVVIGFLACGWLSDRFGAQIVVTSSMFVMTLSLLPFVALTGLLPLVAWYAIFFIFGVSGAFNIVLLAQLRAFFPPSMSGRVATALNTFGFAGAWLIQWWMGVVINYFVPDSAGSYPPVAYATAFGITMGCCALSLAWYLPLAAMNAAPTVTTESDSPATG